MTTIYKICPAEAWHSAEAEGVFHGIEVDIKDGYIHFSTRAQVAETAAKLFANQDDLVLVALDSDRLGPVLKWEPARSGALFPHLYGGLALDAVLWVKPLPLGGDGRHRFPELEA